MNAGVAKLMSVRGLFGAFQLCVVALLIGEPSMVASFVVVGAIVALLSLVKWHTRISSFACPQCSARFNITALVNFLSPHVPDKKWLYCPECHQSAWYKRVPG